MKDSTFYFIITLMGGIACGVGAIIFKTPKAVSWSGPLLMTIGVLAIIYGAILGLISRRQENKHFEGILYVDNLDEDW